MTTRLSRGPSQAAGASRSRTKRPFLSLRLLPPARGQSPASAPHGTWPQHPPSQAPGCASGRWSEWPEPRWLLAVPSVVEGDFSRTQERGAEGAGLTLPTRGPPRSSERPPDRPGPAETPSRAQGFCQPSGTDRCPGDAGTTRRAGGTPRTGRGPPARPSWKAPGGQARTLEPSSLRPPLGTAVPHVPTRTQWRAGPGLAAQGTGAVGRGRPSWVHPSLTPNPRRGEAALRCDPATGPTAASF